MIIDGKKFAQELRNEIKKEIESIKKTRNTTPGLTVILVGNHTPSEIYVRNKELSAKEVGITSEVIRFESSPLARMTPSTFMTSVQNFRRSAFMSITTHFAPETLTNSTAERPIGPEPMTRTVSPALGAARSTAWQPMASVSTSASWS